MIGLIHIVESLKKKVKSQWLHYGNIHSIKLQMDSSYISVYIRFALSATKYLSCVINRSNFETEYKKENAYSL